MSKTHILTAARNIAHILLLTPTKQWQATSNDPVLLTEYGDIQEETTYEVQRLLSMEDPEKRQYTIQCATSDPHRPIIYITPENHSDFNFEVPSDTSTSLNTAHPPYSYSYLPHTDKYGPSVLLPPRLPVPHSSSGTKKS